ncbi:3-deoxy-D-manno-octulosonic-acid transferase [Aliiruegeria haliotis]|uniref:3-deoxy-D-manno-octulosonic acid transferase n=1 Tax=Aliiruegeria haliotis TaxID=1280846 RepID=A0A2T0RNA8_9RHOB|nr:glycosyltransferase N-terminal domain-containing protein [Aliiruegeria haliotis]PRY22610.1 3-deoxy-D-manno-octulosonic-acid transferase [Aliiruegeria haliotis]
MFLYRLLLTLLAPLIAGWFALRILQRKETWADLRERLGHGAVPTEAGRTFWVHGASNGELTSARRLIETLLERDADLRIVVTANSLTGRALATGWGHPRLTARLAPLDFRFCLMRFLSQCRPELLILLEGDLWPNRLVLTAARGASVAMISARISEKSARHWSRRPRLCRAIFGAVSLLSAQDAASETRFLSLGLQPEALAPRLTLKATVTLPQPDPALRARYARHFDRDATWLAASTHEGEEQQVIAAHLAARAARPGLRLILAPRHPRRGPEVAALLDSAGLDFATRSKGEDPGDAEVYLADTLGEMPLWYALSGACFVGASLVPKGGHTPYEPAQFGCAILHGTDLTNFAEQYARLEETHAAIQVTDGASLGAALGALTPDRCRSLAAAAHDALGLDAGPELPTLCDRLLSLSSAHASGVDDSRTQPVH